MWPRSGGRPLPVREGVGPSCVALPAGPWATIAQCLIERFAGVDPQVWAARLRAGEVVDEHGVTVDVDRAHQPNLRVYYYREVAGEAVGGPDVPVRCADEQLVVADKPHFMPVTPGGAHLHHTLLVRLRRQLGCDELAPLHRIDRETAGLVLFSRRAATRGLYQQLFARREVRKTYDCIVRIDAAHDRVLGRAVGEPWTYASRLVDDTHFMRMREVPGDANAVTGLELLERRGDLARYRLTPLTGRRHQLRVHCAALGMPIVGDTLYPTLLPAGSDDLARPLQLLARSLSFADPLSGAPREFTSRRSLMWDAPPAPPSTGVA